MGAETRARARTGTRAGAGSGTGARAWSWAWSGAGTRTVSRAWAGAGTRAEGLGDGKGGSEGSLMNLPKLKSKTGKTLGVRDIHRRARGSTEEDWSCQGNSGPDLLLQKCPVMAKGM